MNGIEKITERIAAQSDADVKALMDRANAQAKAIYDGYQAAADQECEAAQRLERLGSVAQLVARKLQLKTKQEMLAEAYDLAYKKLLELPEDQYAQLLTRLAVNASQTGTEALVFSETDRSRYDKRVVVAANELLEQQGKAEESRPCQGGLYVQNGNVEVNCTFAALIRLEKEQTAKDVAGILFD